MQWNELWNARMGDKLNDSDISVWYEEMNHEISNLSGDEIISAVRAIAEDKRIGKIKYKPTLNHLVSTIVRLRYENRNGVSGQGSQTRTQDGINRLRATLRHLITSGDKIGAWNALCNHIPADDIPDTEMWAIETFGFERPTFEEMGLKPLTQVMRELRAGDGLHRVTDEIKTRAKAETTQGFKR